MSMADMNPEIALSGLRKLQVKVKPYLRHNPQSSGLR